MQGRHPRPTIAPPVATRRHPTGAITWIDRDHALIARRSREGAIDVASVRRDTPDASSYLGRIVHEIGDRDRVVILGPGSLRTELEREYVTIYHRPDRLIDVEPASEMTEAELVARLRELSD